MAISDLSQPSVPVFTFYLMFSKGWSDVRFLLFFLFLLFIFGTTVSTCFSSHRCHCRQEFDLKYQRFELISEKCE